MLTEYFSLSPLVDVKENHQNGVGNKAGEIDLLVSQHFQFETIKYAFAID